MRVHGRIQFLGEGEDRRIIQATQSSGILGLGVSGLQASSANAQRTSGMANTKEQHNKFFRVQVPTKNVKYDTGTILLDFWSKASLKVYSRTCTWCPPSRSPQERFDVRSVHSCTTVGLVSQVGCLLLHSLRIICRGSHSNEPLHIVYSFKEASRSASLKGTVTQNHSEALYYYSVGCDICTETQPTRSGR